MKKKVLLVANTGWYIYNFRLSLLKDLRDEGYDVNVVVPKDLFCEQISQEGFKIYFWKLKKYSINPINEFLSLINLIKIYLLVKPQLVHHFTIKACIYGTIAAKFSKVYIVINAVTGLGTLFISKRKRIKILRFLLRPIYSWIFKAKRSFIIFQNESDQLTLLDYGITNTNKSKIIKGSGVDLNHFKPDHKNKKLKKNFTKILFPSRILREKGLFEVVEAFKLLQKEKYACQLIIAGEIDLNTNPTISKREFETIKKIKNITFLGRINNMRKLYSEIDIVVLPSWREGLSKVLIESASMEKAIITSDVPGCRDVINHGLTGLLVPPRNALAIKHALVLLIENPTFGMLLGKRAREKARLDFEVSIINKRTINYYFQLFKKYHLKNTNLK